MDTLALILAIIGAVNWGLVGFARFDGRVDFRRADRERQPHYLRSGRSCRSVVHHPAVPQIEKIRSMNRKNSRTSEQTDVRELLFI